YVPGQKEHYRGDWFFSRSEQGHHLQQVKSTKARLTDVSGEEGKLIISKLGFTIDKLFYRDIHGNWWSFNGDIRMGQRVILQPSNQRSYQAWVATREELSGATARLAFPEALAS